MGKIRGLAGGGCMAQPVTTTDTVVVVREFVSRPVDTPMRPPSCRKTGTLVGGAVANI